MSLYICSQVEINSCIKRATHCYRRKVIQSGITINRTQTLVTGSIITTKKLIGAFAKIKVRKINGID